MAAIDKDNPITTVMVHVTVDPQEQDTIAAKMVELSPLMAAQPGFVSSHLHKSEDGKKLVQYIQWQTIDDHYACLQNEELAAAGAGFMELVASGKIAMDVQVYEVIGSFTPP